MQLDIERRPRLELQLGSVAAGAAGPVGSAGPAAAGAAGAAAAAGRNRLPLTVPTQQEED